MKSHSNMPKYTHKYRAVIEADTWEILAHPNDRSSPSSTEIFLKRGFTYPGTG